MEDVARPDRHADLLGLERPVRAALGLEHSSGAACRPRRRAGRRRRAARRRRRCWRPPARRPRRPSRARAPGPPRIAPVAAAVGPELVAAEEQRKAHLGTSMLPNLMPPAACHSPAAGQPSPAGEAPPPGRAWNRCQMNGRAVRGSMPWSAMRKRRPQPAIARSGQAGASALMIASMISWPQWLVHSVTGAPGRAQTTVPSLAITVQRPERAVVLGRLRVDQIGQRHDDGRAHVGVATN